jgi:hypothetical protein
MKVIAFIALVRAAVAGLPACSPDPRNMKVVLSSRAGAIEFLVIPAN